MATPSAPAPRRASSSAVVVVVAVLIGLGIGRFVTAGSGEPTAVTTTRVAAAPDLAGQVVQLERAVATDPQDLASLQALATAYVDRAAESGDASYYARAERTLDAAKALAPADAETLLAEGALRLAQHDFADALVVGERAMQQRPDTAAVLAVVVDAQVELGRYDDAAATLQRMLDRRPGLPALARASYLRQLAGDLPGAVTAMQQASAAGTTSGYAQAVVDVLLGDLYLARDELEAASGSYAAALRSSPELVGARLGQLRVQAAAGDLAGAVTSLDELTRERPTVAGLTLLRELQALAGDDEAAGRTAGVLRSVAALQEASGQVVDLEMALFEADAGDPVEALRFAQAAHASRPDNVFVNDALAWALHRAGRSVQALPHVEQALRLGTEDPLLRFHAAEVLAATGDLDGARRELQRVAAAAPWTVLGHLREVAELAGRLGVALPAAWSDAAGAA